LPGVFGLLKLIFSDNAWEDYLFWQKTDKKILRRVNALIKETKRNPFDGIGKTEPLKHALSGYWSRRHFYLVLGSLVIVEQGKPRGSQD
jgi:toxin YoeB